MVDLDLVLVDRKSRILSSASTGQAETSSGWVGVYGVKCPDAYFSDWTEPQCLYQRRPRSDSLTMVSNNSV